VFYHTANHSTFRHGSIKLSGYYVILNYNELTGFKKAYPLSLFRNKGYFNPVRVPLPTDRNAGPSKISIPDKRGDILPLTTEPIVDSNDDPEPVSLSVSLHSPKQAIKLMLKLHPSTPSPPPPQLLREYRV